MAVYSTVSRIAEATELLSICKERLWRCLWSISDSSSFCSGAIAKRTQLLQASLTPECFDAIANRTIPQQVSDDDFVVLYTETLRYSTVPEGQSLSALFALVCSFNFGGRCEFGEDDHLLLLTLSATGIGLSEDSDWWLVWYLISIQRYVKGSSLKHVAGLGVVAAMCSLVRGPLVRASTGTTGREISIAAADPEKESIEVIMQILHEYITEIAATIDQPLY